ncbi:MAG: NCS2 family permease [Bacteroidales bacterium]|nr:NCS2 family permease [Bacteroidales bacterium]
MSLLKKLFGFDSRTMSLQKEVTGGVTTFLIMSYILAVNPAVLSETGMDANALFTTTVLASVLATVMMAVYAKMPFALAPSMGVSAFFVYTIVMEMGYTWQFGLTAVFVEGIIFILLTMTGLRERIVDAMPYELCKAISPGIGLFIALIGLHNAGIIDGSEETMVTLGNLHNPSVLLAAAGILFTVILLVRNVPGALLIGILATAAAGIPLGLTHFERLLNVPPGIEPIFMKMQWENIMSIDMAVCVATLLFMDIFDTMGTLIGVGQRVGLANEKGDMPGMNKAFMADSIGTTAGAMLGTTTVSTFIESAAGVNAGGRSGLTAMVTALCFLLALFFAPLFVAIPKAATAPAMFIVGMMMMGDVVKLDFRNYSVAVPCFVCIVFMPFAYSISDGILLGVITWVAVSIFSGRTKELKRTTVMLAMLFVLKYVFL